MLFRTKNEVRVHSDGHKNLVCDIPNYHKSLLKMSTNVASVLLSFCKLISLYIDVHFLLTFGFSLRPSLIYLNEAIKHCGRANLGAACTQAHHVCYFMIFEKGNLKCLDVWQTDNLLFLSLCQIWWEMPRHGTKQHHVSWCF